MKDTERMLHQEACSALKLKGDGFAVFCFCACTLRLFINARQEVVLVTDGYLRGFGDPFVQTVKSDVRSQCLYGIETRGRL